MPSTMYDIKITAIRKADYRDLQALYENPIEHTCDLHEGQQWVSRGGAMPEGMCESAWESMRWFVEELAAGRGNFYDGWMRNPYSALISCNDGFRPVSFLLERIEKSPTGNQIKNRHTPITLTTAPTTSRTVTR